MKTELQIQIEDLAVTSQLKIDAKNEESRLRKERVSLSKTISDLKTNLNELESSRESMKGLSANKLVALSKEIALVKIEIESLEESMIILSRAVDERIRDHKGRSTDEKETKALIANIILKDKSGDFKLIMDELMKYWGLYSHNVPYNFKSSLAFGEWMQAQFSEVLYPELSHGGHIKYLDDALKIKS